MKKHMQARTSVYNLERMTAVVLAFALGVAMLCFIHLGLLAKATLSDQAETDLASRLSRNSTTSQEMPYGSIGLSALWAARSAYLMKSAASLDGSAHFGTLIDAFDGLVASAAYAARSPEPFKTIGQGRLQDAQGGLERLTHIEVLSPALRRKATVVKANASWLALSY